MQWILQIKKIKQISQTQNHILTDSNTGGYIQTIFGCTAQLYIMLLLRLEKFYVDSMQISQMYYRCTIQELYKALTAYSKAHFIGR